jgi:hypothetical protein
MPFQGRTGYFRKNSRKYKYGIIACHDGNVIKYKITGKPNIAIYYSELVRLDEKGYTKNYINEFMKSVRNAGVEIEVL